MQKSESIRNIAKALAGFQADVKNPANTADNPFYKSKYAPLSDVLNIVRPLLTKHGLSVFQSPSGDGQNVTVTTVIMHESGEWIESDPLTLKADKATAQGAGSAITYARRYAISAVLGISSEDDDDGNFASGKNNGQVNVSGDKATPKQLQKLHAIANSLEIPSEEMRQHIKSKYGKESSKDLTKAEVRELIDELEKTKK
jgi:hypothetical protein